MILKNKNEKDYELVDSGSGKKLERYGDLLMVRPDPEAIWSKNLSQDIWDKASMYYKRHGKNGSWIYKKDKVESWVISYGDLKFLIKPTGFKHIGLFPEQKIQWDWIKSKLAKKDAKVLNLFAYTGGSTLACASCGAEVVHVDASKQAVSWARENAELSGLKDSKIRWIIDDCIAFLKREVKRGSKYDAIIMDPPSFGHGPKDELWKIEEHFMDLVNLCQKVLSENPIFIIMNGYTAGYSSVAYENVLKDMMKNYKGTVESGELVIEQSSSDKLLPCGIFARWEAK
jgi:23S rRNA (cytosine1962-C5)-methyltransferase